MRRFASPGLIAGLSLVGAALPVSKAHAWYYLSRANCAYVNESITIGDSWFTGQGGSSYAAGTHYNNAGGGSDYAQDGPHTIIRADALHFHSSTSMEVWGVHQFNTNGTTYDATSSASDCNWSAEVGNPFGC